MKLNIVFEEYSMAEIQNSINKYFGCKVNYKKEVSVFDSWRLGCKDKFIPEIWKYRIVKKDDRYIFGSIEDSEKNIRQFFKEEVTNALRQIKEKDNNKRKQ
jgi:hypothetical protein